MRPRSGSEGTKEETSMERRELAASERMQEDKGVR